MRAHARVVNVRAIIMCAFYNPLKFGGEILRKRKKKDNTLLQMCKKKARFGCVCVK